MILFFILKAQFVDCTSFFNMFLSSFAILISDTTRKGVFDEKVL